MRYHCFDRYGFKPKDIDRRPWYKEERHDHCLEQNASLEISFAVSFALTIYFLGSFFRSLIFNLILDVIGISVSGIGLFSFVNAYPVSMTPKRELQRVIFATPKP